MSKKCEHTDELSGADEGQHWIKDDQFWFTMQCDTCGVELKTLVEIKEWDWKEKN